LVQGQIIVSSKFFAQFWLLLAAQASVTSSCSYPSYFIPLILVTLIPVIPGMLKNNLDFCYKKLNSQHRTIINISFCFAICNSIFGCLYKLYWYSRHTDHLFYHGNSHVIQMIYLCSFCIFRYDLQFPTWQQGCSHV